mmetsp:Transcript_42310/g.76747  ORF Transcript_42310/g.76747 Transcript_42310/m.76747 type:complete len:102 (-) Transcript_42310:287-592(-)
MHPMHLSIDLHSQTQRCSYGAYLNSTPDCVVLPRIQHAQTFALVTPLACAAAVAEECASHVRSPGANDNTALAARGRSRPWLALVANSPHSCNVAYLRFDL